MGSKLAVLAAAYAATLSAAAAQPRKPEPPPSDIYKRAIEAYQAGRYDEAADLLEKSYQLTPKVEILFALAQAERLGGHCDKAIPHYKKLLDQTTDLATAKAVQTNVALCPSAEPKTAPKVEPKSEPSAAPVVQTKTVVREVRKSDPVTIALIAGGALGGGFAIGMFMRSSSTRDDATKARTLDDANDLNDRADRDRLIGIVAGGASALAIGYAVFRLVRGSSTSTEVAVTPTQGGSMMVLSKTW